MNPTPELVKDFWKHMTGVYNAEVVDKRDSALMNLIADGLSALGVTDKQAFLTRFTTTIGRRIYTPFEVGVETSLHSLWGQMVICPHECQHVAQLDEIGELQFEARYLISSMARAEFEVAGYRCNLEMDHWRYGKIVDVHELAGRLRGYGCSSAEISVAERMLSIAALTVNAGGVVSEAFSVAKLWLDMYAGELREPFLS